MAIFYIRWLWGVFKKAMHNDLIDGIDWAVKQGISDPNNIAIMGASYGGYATLVGMTLTPISLLVASIFLERQILS